MVHRSGSFTNIFDETDENTHLKKENKIVTDKIDSSGALNKVASSSITAQKCKKSTNHSLPVSNIFNTKQSSRKGRSKLRKNVQNSLERTTVPSQNEDFSKTDLLLTSGHRSFSLENLQATKINVDSNKSSDSTISLSERKKNCEKNINLNKSKSVESVFVDGNDNENFDSLPKNLTCSLPLERLTGILNFLKIKKPSHLLQQQSPTDELEEEDLEDKDGNLSSTKSLCFYCDKKFSSQKIRAKHTERFHTLSKDRRSSSRNPFTVTPTTSSCFKTTTKNDRLSHDPQFLNGCSYCSKQTKLQGVAIENQLDVLFHHLIEHHSDKYFACKTCAVRFQDFQKLSEHNDINHKNINWTNANEGGTENNSVKLDFKFVQPLHIEVNSNSSSDKEIELTSTTKTRRQLKQAMESYRADGSLMTRSLSLTTLSSQNSNSSSSNNSISNSSNSSNIYPKDGQILTRLGVTQNRLPKGRKGIRSRRQSAIEVSGPSPVKIRSKVGRVCTSNDPIDSIVSTRLLTNNRVEPLSCTFDDDFYETVSANVKQNLRCHLDGKLDGGPTSPCPMSPVASVPAIRSTVVKSPLIVDNEIHAATSLSTVTAFPTLLTADQYGCDYSMSSKIKRPITKHSWKWKWDSVKKYKYVNEGGKIIKKVKHPILGLRDLSKLDMWTQLTMRRKHEMMSKQSPDYSRQLDLMNIGEVVREEKRKQIDQLNMILDKRLLPQIILEQNDQSLIKEETIELVDLSLQTMTSKNVIDNNNKISDDNDFPRCLNLIRSLAINQTKQNQVVLSGEWARPRCYICFGCGARFDKLKTLEEHKMFRHPYVYSTHYEIVGRELIEGNLYKHFFIPTKALNRHRENRLNMITYKTEVTPSSPAEASDNSASEESLDSIRSVPASFSTSSDTDTKTTLTAPADANELSSYDVETSISTDQHFTGNCTKCQRECHGMLELYKHMLDCSGDYAWILAKKRKYRYFGSKKRRPFNKSLPGFRKTKIKESSSPKSPGSSKETPKMVKLGSVPSLPRTKPSDAESIQKMLENLPAKRTSKQIIPDITKPRVRKFSNVNAKYKLKSNCRSTRNIKTSKVIASTTLNAISKNIRRTHKLKIIKRHRKIISQPSENEIDDQEEISESSSKTKKKLVELSRLEIKKPNIIKTEKNMVKSIGTKTKYFVKKLTQKFKSKKNNNKSIIIKNIDSNSINNNKTKAKLESNKMVSKRKGERFLRKLSLRKTRNNIQSSNKQNNPENDEKDISIKKKEKAVVNKKITKRCVVKLFDKIKSNSLVEPAKESNQEIQKYEAKNNNNRHEEKEEQEQQLNNNLIDPVEETLTIDVNKEDDHESLIKLCNIKEQGLSSSHQNLTAINQTSPGSKRRSKKLNDCIAMLTGKLQEKLGKPFLETQEETKHLDSVFTILSNQSNTNKKDLNESIVRLNCDKNELDRCSEAVKKTPKRKAMTRKIVKINQNDSADDLINQQNNNPKNSTTIKNVELKTTESLILGVSTTEKELTTACSKVNDARMKSFLTSATNYHKTDTSPPDISILSKSKIINLPEKELKGNKARKNVLKKSNDEVLSNIDKSIEEVVRTSAILADEEELKAKANALVALNAPINCVGTVNIVITTPVTPLFSHLNMPEIDAPLDLSKKPSSNLSCKPESKTNLDKSGEQPLQSPISEVLDLSKSSFKINKSSNPTSNEINFANMPSLQKYTETLKIPNIKSKTRLGFGSNELLIDLPVNHSFLSVDSQKCNYIIPKEVTTLNVPKPANSLKPVDIGTQSSSADITAQYTSLDTKTKRKTKKNSNNHLNINKKSSSLPTELSKMLSPILDIPVLNIPKPFESIDNKLKNVKELKTLENKSNVALTSIGNEPIIENSTQPKNIVKATPLFKIPCEEMSMSNPNTEVSQTKSLNQCIQSEHLSTIIVNENIDIRITQTNIDSDSILKKDLENSSETNKSNLVSISLETAKTSIDKSEKPTLHVKEKKVKKTKSNENVLKNIKKNENKLKLDSENNFLEQDVFVKMIEEPQNSSVDRSEIKLIISDENRLDIDNHFYPKELKKIPEVNNSKKSVPVVSKSLKNSDKKQRSASSEREKGIVFKQQRNQKPEHEKDDRPKRKVTLKSKKVDGEKLDVGESKSKIANKNSKMNLKKTDEGLDKNVPIIKKLNESLNTPPTKSVIANELSENIDNTSINQQCPNKNFEEKSNKRSLEIINVTNRRATRRTSIKKTLVKCDKSEIVQSIKTNNPANVPREETDLNVLPKNIIPSASNNKNVIKESPLKAISKKGSNINLPKDNTKSIEKSNVVRRSARHKSFGENLPNLQNKLSIASGATDELEGDLLARKEVDDILASFLNDDENAILQESLKMETINRPTRIDETIDLPSSDLSHMDEWNSVDVSGCDNFSLAEKKKDTDLLTIQRSNHCNRDDKQSKPVNECDSIEIEEIICVDDKNTENADKNINNLKDENSCSSTATGLITKKQRRRRKNELAAIVADQLLESFKEVDQSRIEDLKLLENLAYEKNEDLLLTGMRLTPTTRRKSVKLINEPIQSKDDKEISKTAKKEAVTDKNIQQLTSKSSKFDNQREDILENKKLPGGQETQKKAKKGLQSKYDVSVGDKRSQSIKIDSSHEKEADIVSKTKNLISSTKETEYRPDLEDEPISKKTNKSTSQFDVYRTLKNSFQTFRSMDFGLNKKNKPKASNMSKLLELPEFSIPLQVPEDTKAGELKGIEMIEKKSTSLHKKLRKKLSKKKEKNCSESENINEVRSVLESFTFGKDDQSKAEEVSQFPRNITSNVGSDGLFSKQIRNKISVPNLNLDKKLNTSGVKKKTPILRPSILAATLDTTLATLMRTNTTETKNSIKFSRDPRLNKNIHADDRPKSPDIVPKTDQRKMGSIRQRRKSENLSLLLSSKEDELNTALMYPRERLRSSSRRAAAAVKQQIKSDAELKMNKIDEPSELSDEEDNYLALIAKNVNEKIMSADDKDFNSANDGFELANKFLGNSEPYSRPSTSLSMCSAPNFNDDHSNMTFNENTNNDLLDMDLDDDISIYTSFSQDVSRGRGRGKNGGRRRRRRSILMTRRSRKASTSTINPNETYDCELCLKSFSKASTLAKHQMSLSHVSKVSEQEYLNSTRMNSKENKSKKEATCYNQEERLEEKARTSTDFELNRLEVNSIIENDHNRLILKDELITKPLSENNPDNKLVSVGPLSSAIANKNIPIQEKQNLVTLPSTSILNQSVIEPISSPEQNDLYPANSSSRLTLNPDERLFYECCNILKGSETPLVERTYTALSSTKYVYDIPKSIVPKSSEHFNQPNLIPRRGNYTHPNNNTTMNASKSISVKQFAYPSIDINQFSDISSDSSPAKAVTSYKPPCSTIPSQFTDISVNKNQRCDTFYGIDCHSSQVGIKQRIPTEMTARVFINQPSQSVYSDQLQPNNDGTLQHKQSFMSPVHSTSSQGSTLATVPTSRLKTKAAMKGYDNLKVSIPTIGLNMQQALECSPHRSCKLTALAEIALGNEAPKTNMMRPNQLDEGHADVNEQFSKKYQELSGKIEKKTEAETTKMRQTKRAREPELQQKEKDIYDFEESQDEIRSINTTKPTEKIIIPDRPFKNIGLDEQQTIKFQKPETFVQNEESVMSIISYSDRDDFNYGSLSDAGEDYVDPDKNIDYLNNELNDCTDISSNSSAVTAKTFENKSLIMGRIFNKKATAKSKLEENLPTVKITETNKRQMPKQDLDRLFDKLRGFDEVSKDGSPIDMKVLKRKDILSEKQPRVSKRKSTNEKVSKTDTNKSNLNSQNKIKSSKSIKNKLIKSSKMSTSIKRSKTISKRNSETSLSQGDELQMLNDDGKRKSQRRCTANRSKKLVEMWSSDEYEEFLSTNDIIALIEEKEKVDQQKKKKPASETTTSLKKPNTELVKQPKAVKIPLPKEDANDKNIKNLIVDKKKRSELIQSKRDTQLKKNDDSVKPKRVHQLLKKTSENNSEKHLKPKVSRKSKEKNNSITEKKYQSTSKAGNQIQIIESESEFEADNKKKPNIKDLKRRKTISFKGEPKIKQKKSNKTTHLKKATASKFNKLSNANKLTNTTKPMTRRKRIASEMLYYWSSSSDEEFGRIESPRDDEDDLVDESGEHYQQHGWIVGDSHKKLVTLLAIAKGTKKVDDCGVKQTKKKV